MTLSLATLAALALFPGQTAQMEGVEGEIGKLYELNTTDKLYFTLKSLEYSVTRLAFGGYVQIPNSNEKFLVARFTVQNAENREVKMDARSIRFTAVSADDANFEMVNLFGIADTLTSFNMKMKPAQKVEVIAAVRMPNDIDVPKLIVMPKKNDPGRVIRYMISGKVNALPEVFQQDKKPFFAGQIVNAPRESFMPMAVSDIWVPKGALMVSQTNGTTKAPNGQSFYSLNAKIRNGHSVEFRAKALYLKGEMGMASGEKTALRFCRVPGTDTQFTADLLPGVEAPAEFVFQAPSNAKPTYVRLWETHGGGASRSYKFDYSN